MDNTATLFFSETISASAVVSFDVLLAMFVVLAEILVLLFDDLVALAAMAFLSELMCKRLSAISLVFVAMLVVFVEMLDVLELIFKRCDTMFVRLVVMLDVLELMDKRFLAMFCWLICPDLMSEFT